MGDPKVKDARYCLHCILVTWSNTLSDACMCRLTQGLPSDVGTTFFVCTESNDLSDTGSNGLTDATNVSAGVAHRSVSDAIGA